MLLNASHRDQCTIHLATSWRAGLLVQTQDGARGERNARMCMRLLIIRLTLRALEYASATSGKYCNCCNCFWTRVYIVNVRREARCRLFRTTNIAESMPILSAYDEVSANTVDDNCVYCIFPRGVTLSSDSLRPDATKLFGSLYLARKWFDKILDDRSTISVLGRLY